VDGSAESGFVGILNVGAIDRRYPITEETAPALRANIVSMKDATQVEVDEGRMTPAQKQLIDHFCDKATGQLDICAQLTKDYVDAQKVKEKNEKAAKEKAVHDAWEHVKTDTGRVGDFPKDWGGAMGKC
jgi:plasmid replication initiation protein